MFQFKYARIDLRSLDAKKLKLLHDGIIDEFFDDTFGDHSQPPWDDVHRQMAMIFVIDYIEKLCEEVDKGIDYNTAVENYTGATIYIHHLMKDGDFRTEQERQDERLKGMKIKQEEE